MNDTISRCRTRLLRGAAWLSAAASMACAAEAPAAGRSHWFTDRTPESWARLAVGDCLLSRDLNADDVSDIVTLSVDEDQTRRPLILLGQAHGGFSTFRLEVPEEGSYGSCNAVDLDGDGREELVFAPMGRQDAARGAPPLVVSWGRDEPSILPSRWPPPEEPVAIFVGWPGVDGPGTQLLTASGPRVTEGRCAREQAGPVTCRMDEPGSPASPALLGPPPHRGQRLGWTPAIDLNLHLLDWNGDGRIDVFRSVDFGASQLLVDDGSGRLVDQLPALGASRYAHNMGIALADFDRNGRLDWFATDVGNGYLWMQGPDGAVSEEGAARGTSAATRSVISWCPLAADFDRDGDVDLFVPNSAVAKDDAELFAIAMGSHKAPSTTIGQQGHLVLANDGTGRFSHEWIADSELMATVGPILAAEGDFDGDGRVDVAVLSGDDRGGRLRILGNETVSPATAWVGLRAPAGTPPGTVARIKQHGRVVLEHMFVRVARCGGDGIVTVGLETSDEVSAEWAEPGRPSRSLGPLLPGRVHRVSR